MQSLILLISPIFTPSLFTLLIYISFGFIVSIILKRNDIADVMWGPGIFISSLMFFLSSSNNNLNFQAYLILFLIFIWATRIFLHIGIRFINKKEEDKRYAIWRETWTNFYTRSFFQIFILQGFLMFLMSFSLFSTLGNTQNISLILNTSYFNYFVFTALILGFIISISGLIFETFADLQLKNFLNSKKTNSDFLYQDKILKTGLWKYTRHPNYFGEITFWFGIFIISLPYLFLYSLIPICLISYLILYVSGIPMLEKKYEGDKEFEDYKSKTNAFFPWFQKLK